MKKPKKAKSHHRLVISSVILINYNYELRIMSFSIKSASDDLFIPKDDALSQFGVTACVFSTAQHKRDMASLDKYKMKNTGVVQKLQDLVFDEKLEDFKRKVENDD